MIKFSNASGPRNRVIGSGQKIPVLAGILTNSLRSSLYKNFVIIFDGSIYFVMQSF